MPKLELKLDNIREHGFPYACMMCGSDESPKPRKKTFRTDDGIAGYGCAFFLGPIGWVAALIFFLVKLTQRKNSFAVPICDCCDQARIKLNNRDIAMFALGLGAWISTGVYNLGDSLGSTVILLGFGAMLAAALEHAIYHKQFRLRTLVSEPDRVLLDIPNEDYPAMYQRHLDTAVLYGCVENMGADEA